MAGWKIGHPIIGAVFGLILGIFVTLDLTLAGVVRLDSSMLWVLAPVGLVGGLLLGLWAPIRRR